MIKLLASAVAPVIICAIYVFIRDRYEKEPIKLLITGIIFGVMSAGIIIPISNITRKISFSKDYVNSLYEAFITSGGVEETVKFIILYLLVWKNANFNEWFDGIIYGVFVSLGFAMIENIVYVYNPIFGGFTTAVRRAIFSVPAHALFGVAMGYQLSIAKFKKQEYKTDIILALVIPWLLHSLFNSILLLELENYMFVLLPYTIFLWIQGFEKMKEYNEISPFKN